jgi:hypothetical protein
MLIEPRGSLRPGGAWLAGGAQRAIALRSEDQFSVLSDA